MAKGKKKIIHHPRSFLPRSILAFFAIAALILVPWTIFLAQSLPTHHMDRRWNLVWSGFDIGLLLSLGLTAYWGLRKSGWVVAAASVAGAFLLIDAWFDCVTAKQGWEYGVSLSLAAFAEIPMAVLSFWIAYRAGKHYFKK